MNITIYTDGAASNNQNAELRVGGWAAILVATDNSGNVLKEVEISGKVPSATNNEMELRAIYEGLGMLTKEGVTVTIATDSAYVIGVLSLNWKVKANVDFVKEIKQRIAKHKVTFVKVEGHTGHTYNERCDKLAVAATKS